MSNCSACIGKGLECYECQARICPRTGELDEHPNDGDGIGEVAGDINGFLYCEDCWMIRENEREEREKDEQGFRLEALV